MLKLSSGSCMLRLGLRLSIGSCMLRLGLRLRLRLSFRGKRPGKQAQVVGLI